MDRHRCGICGPANHGHDGHRRHVGGERAGHFLCPGSVLCSGEILQARAQLGITRADQFPTIAGDAEATNQRSPRSKFLPAFETSANQVGGSLAWDLDFWGKYRRATEAARADLVASEWARGEVITALI